MTFSLLLFAAFDVIVVAISAASAAATAATVAVATASAVWNEDDGSVKIVVAVSPLVSFEE